MSASLIAFAMHGMAVEASAQCLGWSTQFGAPFGLTPSVLLSFDDGTGPALYVGEYGVDRWTGSSWQVLNGLTGSIDAYALALCAFDDGSGLALYAGGDFEYASGAYSPGIARWTGSSWSPVGGGLWSQTGLVSVASMCVFDDGSGPALFVGGQLDAAPGLAAFSHGIMKWDGAAWSGLAGGITGNWGSYPPLVFALAVFDDGGGPALYAGGTFTAMGGVPASMIAKWDGATWYPLGTGMDSGVDSLAVYDDGGGPALYAAGSFHTAGGVPTHGPARWNGTSWSAVGSNSTLGGARAMAVFDDGSGKALYVGCDGSANGTPFGNVCRWDGSRWNSLGNGVDGQVLAMATHDDGSGGGAQLYLAGPFFFVGDHIPSSGIAEWMGCHTQIAPICVGDGTFAPCPCGNHGLAGRGCENSTGQGGVQLRSTGNTIPDTLLLISEFEPSTALSIFVMGDTMTSTPILFGDGIRCAGGNLLRMYVHAAAGGTAYGPHSGEPSISQRAANLGFPIFPGSARYFQTYYRDGVLGFCPPPTGSSFNTSNGLRVIW